MPSSIRFGVYELRLDALELRKHGVPIRLQQQPLRVLVMLTDRPGEIITREQLQDHIWGTTFVDFDQSLNKAINRLREALNDNAGTPQFIETVPRRGYRFIAAVAPASQTELPQGTAADNAVVTADPVPPQVNPLPLRRVVVAVSIIASILAAIYITVVSRHHSSPAAAEARLIASFGWCPALSRDGKLLAYTSSIGGGLPHIWVRQTAGGEAIPITSGPYEDAGADFSPDGTHIAFFSERNGGGIYIAPTLPGEARMLVADGGYPRFSPNGDSILYWHRDQAFTIPVDGSQPIALPLNQEFRVDGPPLWSPDGKEILFYGVRKSEQDKAGEWWMVPLTQSSARLVHLPRIEQDAGRGFAVRAWLRAADDREWIVYSSTNHESWKVWRAGVSSRGQVEETPELLASGNGYLYALGSASRDGKVAYSIGSSSAAIYQISLSNRGQKVGSTLQLPLSEYDTQFSPSVSRDGRWMANASTSLGRRPTIHLRNLDTGTDHLLDERDHESGQGEASISPDGSTVIFERDCKQGKWPDQEGSPMPCSFVIASAGGKPEQVCDGCTPRGFSSDGSVVLLQKYDPVDLNKSRIVALDLRTKRMQDFLGTPSGPLFHAYFSWDDHWVVFKTIQSLNLDQAPSRILIAPVRHGVAAGEAEWIAVTDGKNSDDKPQFSADGNTVYFTSTRDGYLCIWAQRLNPVTKHPIGPPFAFEHFHNSAGHDAVLNQGFCDLSVARDRILINLPLVDPAVWMAQMP
jgi:eukaryotic-like serine/threonine-protein kinase